MTIINQGNSYLPKKSPKQIMADVHRCINDCLECLTQKTAFFAMCDALTLELTAVCDHFAEMSVNYSDRLPVFSEQIHNFDIEDETIKLEEQIDRLLAHPFYDDGYCEDADLEYGVPGDLKLQLGALRQKLIALHNVFYPTDRADLYINYSKDELNVYNKRHWERHYRLLMRNVSAYSVQANKAQFYEEQYQMHLKDLRTMVPKVISDDNLVLYHEAIGHVLWRCAHEEDAELDSLHAVMASVRSVEHFGKLAGHDVVYLDREVGENEVNECGLSADELKEQNQKNQLELVKQASLDWVKFHISTIEERFVAPFSQKWVCDMLDKAFEDNGLRDDIIRKFCSTSRRKTMYQIIGELLIVRHAFDDELKAMEIAEMMGEKFPTERTKKETISNYIRLGITDAESLKKWVDDFLIC